MKWYNHGGLRGTIVLSGVLTLLGVYLYFFEIRGQKQEAAQQETAQRLFSFSEQELTDVTIAGSGDPLVLKASSGQPEMPFLISSPIDSEVDTGVASAFVSQLTNLKWTQKIEENPSDLVPYGFNAPAHSVKIGRKGVKSDLLIIGGENITGSGLYAQVGNTVYIIEKGIKTYLDKELNDWRRKEVFRFVASDVTSIYVGGKGDINAAPAVVAVFDLVKEGEAWRMNALPLDEKVKPETADASKVFRFLGDLSSLRGEAFIDENKAEQVAQLGTPIFSIKLSFAATEQAGVFYKDVNDPDFIYAVTTPNAPLYKISLKRFEGIQQPMSYFKPEEKPDTIDKGT